MKSFNWSEADWTILKEKFKRKYNHLTDHELSYEPGNEKELIEKLAKRIHRTPEYILFTLEKEFANLTNNKL